ncbi:MAG: hypothetical protein V3R97_00910, partial [Gemmatimonadales bacterium]
MKARTLLSLGFLTLFVAPLTAQSVASSASVAGMIGFASAVVVSGDEMFVGRPGAFPGFPMPASRAAGVHVFGRSADGSWVEKAVITTPNSDESDGFGQALSVAGDMLVVGAPLARGGMGAAYLYHRGEGGDWALVATLATDDAGEGAGLGSAVVVQGHMAVVGAPGHNNHGIAYVFSRQDDDGWRVRHTVEPDSLADGARFGAAISVHDDRMLVGAPGPGSAASLFGPPPAFQRGAAYVYRMDMENHELVLDAMLVTEEEGLVTQGLVVALVDHGALVSAPGSNGGAGVVLMYQQDEAGAWSAPHTIALETPQPRSFFGSAIAVGGGDLLIGAPTTGGLTGAVHVFHHTEGDSLVHAQELTITASGMGTFFGGSIAVDGNLAVFGAPAADMFSGVGFVFERGDEGWSEAGEVFDAGPGLAALTGEMRRCQDGTSAGFTCDAVDLVAFVPAGELGAGRGVMLNDVWGWTD